MPGILKDIDRAILHELQANGRLSNKDLASKVALSASPCWRRVKDLEQSGLIRGYATILDRQALGLGLLGLAFVSLNDHHPSSVEEFDSAIQDWPEVLECHKISGDHDYMLKVVARDLAAYDTFLSQKLLPLSAVRAVNTSFSMRQPKDTTALPLTML